MLCIGMTENIFIQELIQNKNNEHKANNNVNKKILQFKIDISIVGMFNPKIVLD